MSPTGPKIPLKKPESYLDPMAQAGMNVGCGYGNYGLGSYPGSYLPPWANVYGPTDWQRQAWMLQQCHRKKTTDDFGNTGREG